jgi:hypothetical protein
MTAATTKRKPAWRWLLLPAFLWASIGCNPGALSMLLMPFVDDKIDPPCKLAVKGKEVTVCVLTNFAGLETRSDVIPAEAELPELVAQQLLKRTKENKEKVKIIPPHRTRSYAQNRDGRSLQDIGNQLKADYVVVLEIQDMTLYEKNSSNMLYRGNVDMLVRVIDTKKPDGESAVFHEHYRGEYPGSAGPMDASEMSLPQFRARFLNKVAADVARFFTAYPSDDRRRMD